MVGRAAPSKCALFQVSGSMLSFRELISSQDLKPAGPLVSEATLLYQAISNGLDNVRKIAETKLSLESLGTHI